MNKVAIKLEDISKTFHGVYALKGVSFEIREGEIHSIIGENGAGKSTLMNVLTGVYKSNGGEIYTFGEKYYPQNPLDAQKKGVAMIHQELSVATNLTVAENVFLGRYLKNRLGFIDYRSMNKATDEIFEKLAIENIKATNKVASLSISQRQMVEIAKAISTDARVIIMDEPTSSLTIREAEHLLQTMKDLSQQGVTVIFISHRMDEVFKISDSITVMRDSRYIATLDKNETTPEKVISLMVGRDLGDMEYIDRGYDSKEEILEVRNLRTKELNNINFTLKKGEILGFAGLVGSGRTEVARALFKLDSLISGEVYLNGEKVNVKNPKTAIQKGLGIVTEDRKQQGIFASMSVKDNILIGNLPKKAKVFVDTKKENSEAEKYRDIMDIRTASVDLAIENLSGGNQQKAIIARWLRINPKVLILDEPTRGVDVGSKVEIYNLIRKLADNGVGVIMISSELPEILRMCERTVVMANGEITAVLERKDITQETIMKYATISVAKQENYR